MKYLDVEIRLPEELLHPMAAFVRDSEAVSYEELLAWNVDPSAGVEQVLFYVEGDADRYRDQVSTVETIQSVRVEPIDDQSLHLWAREEIRPETAAWRGSFAGRQLVVVPPIRFDADAAMSMTVVGDGGDMQAALAALPPAVDVTVREVGSYDRRGGGLAGSLTDRQRRALATAHEVGYYDVPRTGTLADVAEAMSCAQSTASLLVRRAERDVVGSLVSHLRTPTLDPA
ncbi:helix-turn-helix domain-containing protein [Haloarcula salinisoli]|uniref:Helix-turn-helix domain-containing protein n=1 Tax=Haloarcula salinisoli TaxID=2487746 RepID=A0A8J7YMC0_9EURY|nr:helix-turn-helix domain-containing protein [Halomicroarcula salinisoli]MBX0286484.1 helix-turn-helix domain-containing protein [Halomicroarcula salinisoli]MBX0303833.1 helix-turn-helix domain-containing protein [Halomicroarcula salinisoli]